MDVQRILMRGHKSPFRVASATETLADNLIGNNVGNLVFAQAAYRLLDTSQGRVDVRKFSEFVADEVNESYDVLVVPLANAFRPSFVAELRRMTRVIRRLTIPVVVLGVGAQSNLGKGNAPGEDMAPDVKDFVSAVLDRSASMGVRGESTAEYLAGLGFGADVIDVIGCPSMFMNGPELTIDKLPGGIDRRAPISFNVSPYLHRIGPLSLQFAEQYPNLMYAAQDHLTLGLMLHGKYKAKSAPPAGTPTTLDHPLIAQNRVRFCLDPRTWMQYLSGFDFSVGTRIHGNITALLAGVPALVLAHDSRTLELARYHEIPHRLLRIARSNGPIWCAGTPPRTGGPRCMVTRSAGSGCSSFWLATGWCTPSPRVRIRTSSTADWRRWTFRVPFRWGGSWTGPRSSVTAASVRPSAARSSS